MKRGSATKKSGTKDINRALAKLKALVKAGKLEVIGKQNTRAYVPIGRAFFLGGGMIND